MIKATVGWNQIYSQGYGRRYPLEPLVVYVARLRAAGFTGTKALDIGFGTVADMVMLHENGFEVHGVDVAENAVIQGRKALSARQIPHALGVWVPGTQFDYPDAAFDLVVAIGCLHYNLDQRQILGEIRRVLKPGARFMATYHGPRFPYWVNTKIVRPGVRKYEADYPNEGLRDVEFVYFQTEEELATLYRSCLDDVEVSHYSYRILGRETSFWLVTAGLRA